MKKIILVIYDPSLDSDILRDRIKSLGPNYTFWGNHWFVETTYTTKEVYEKISANEFESNSILVIEMLKDYVRNFPPIAPDIIKAAKNPLSVIYSESKGLAKNVSADSTICIRVVDNEFCKALIHKLGRPITSTSANLAGDTAPSIFAEITEHIKASVDYVVQLYHDVLTKPKASTIIRLYDDNSFDIIRQ